jgi:hypothetical protein
MPLRGLIALCKEVVTGYPILYGSGVISKILGDDMASNIGRLEGAADALEARSGGGGDGGGSATLGDLLSAPGASPHEAGVYGARWVSRTLRFVALLLQKLGADPALSISAAGRATYTVAIAPYHQPVMAAVVSFVLWWAPSRAWVLSGPLGGASNQAASTACAALSVLVGPVAEAVERALEDKKFNFHDRISAIPGGW